MCIVGQKTTVKMYEEDFPHVIRVSTNWLLPFSRSDPALKCSLCSSCNTALIPGSSASVRVKSTCFTDSYAWMVPDHSQTFSNQIKLESSSHGHLVVYTCLHCESSKGIPAPPTLYLALAAGTKEGAEKLEGSTPIAALGSPESSGWPLTMAPPSQSLVPKEEEKKSIFSPRPPSRPPPLPLFARPDAGHVIFRGNEVLDQ
jgi:ribonuclease P protein subunit RPR2